MIIMKPKTRNILLTLGIVFIVFVLIVSIAVVIVELGHIRSDNMVLNAEEKVQYFNTSEAIYVNAVPIERLEKGWSTKFHINGELIYVDAYHIIHDNETQKIYNEKTIITRCNENIIIGEKECRNTTANIYTVFVHEDVHEIMNTYGVIVYYDGCDYLTGGEQ